MLSFSSLLLNFNFREKNRRLFSSRKKPIVPFRQKAILSTETQIDEDDDDDEDDDNDNYIDVDS